MAGSLTVFLIIWLLVLTVAFVFHWLKIERHMDFSQQKGAKVSQGMRDKMLGKS